MSEKISHAINHSFTILNQKCDVTFTKDEKTVFIDFSVMGIKKQTSVSREEAKKEIESILSWIQD